MCLCSCPYLKKVLLFLTYNRNIEQIGGLKHLLARNNFVTTVENANEETIWKLFLYEEEIDKLEYNKNEGGPN